MKSERRRRSQWARLQLRCVWMPASVHYQRARAWYTSVFVCVRRERVACRGLCVVGCAKALSVVAACESGVVGIGFHDPGIVFPRRSCRLPWLCEERGPCGGFERTCHFRPGGVVVWCADCSNSILDLVCLTSSWIWLVQRHPCLSWSSRMHEKSHKR